MFAWRLHEFIQLFVGIRILPEAIHTDDTLFVHELNDTPVDRVHILYLRRLVPRCIALLRSKYRVVFGHLRSIHLLFVVYQDVTDRLCLIDKAGLIRVIVLADEPVPHRLGNQEPWLCVLDLQDDQLRHHPDGER